MAQSPQSIIKEGIPKVGVIMPQPQCQMWCEFCVTDDHLQRMTETQAQNLIRKMADQGFTSLIIGGGEPLLWPHDVLKLAEYGKNFDFFIQIGTNGIRLPQGFESLPQVDRWVLPFESDQAEVHNGLRQYEGGHHGIILERLSALAKVQKSVTLSTVVTNWNLSTLISTGEFLRRYSDKNPNLHAWHIYQFLPLGRGGGRSGVEDSLTLSEKAYDEAFESVKKLELPFKIFKRKNMYESKSVSFFWLENGEIKSRSPNPNK